MSRSILLSLGALASLSSTSRAEAAEQTAFPTIMGTALYEYVKTGKFICESSGSETLFQRGTPAGAVRIGIPGIQYLKSTPLGYEPAINLGGAVSLNFKTISSGEIEQINSPAASGANGSYTTTMVPFSGYKQIVNQAARTLDVKFLIEFPGCDLPFEAIYGY